MFWTPNNSRNAFWDCESIRTRTFVCIENAILAKMPRTFWLCCNLFFNSMLALSLHALKTSRYLHFSGERYIGPIHTSTSIHISSDAVWQWFYLLHHGLIILCYWRTFVSTMARTRHQRKHDFTLWQFPVLPALILLLPYLISVREVHLEKRWSFILRFTQRPRIT